MNRGSYFAMALAMAVFWAALALIERGVAGTFLAGLAGATGFVAAGFSAALGYTGGVA